MEKWATISRNSCPGMATRKAITSHDNTLSALCPACPSTIEDAEHVFFHCPRFYRERLQQVLQEVIEPDNIVRLMLETASNWMAVASFAQSVISRLRQEAQEA
ncbi:hypothetical protein TKK_0015751 [Trichogramma kaykai]